MEQLFSGLKILEFGGGAAGPFGTRYFADHGATVVRVESQQRPDFIRLLRFTPGTEGGVDASHMFAMVNFNKYGIALNMSHPKGPEIARRFFTEIGVKSLELYIDRSAKAAFQLDAAGLPASLLIDREGREIGRHLGAAKWDTPDFPSLQAIKQDLIMISTCLNGQTGPDRNYPGFGGQGSAISGFNHLTGWPDREPLGPYGTITDSLSPRFVALLVTSALLHRKRTGEGQYIDLSQVEGGVVCLSENIVTYTATGEILERAGNRSRHAAPHGAFRCAPKGDDDDRWVTIAVHDDDDWQRFRDAIGNPAWAAEARFTTAARRLALVDELEEHVTSWTRQRAAEDVMTTLQAAGIDAGVVANFEDLNNDPQLAHRGHFREVEHRVIGKHLVEVGGTRFSRTPEAVRMPAPCLGEHSEYVYRELLGMSDEEYAGLKADGVFE